MRALKNADAKQMLSITLQVFISMCQCDLYGHSQDFFYKSIITFTYKTMLDHNHTL